MVADPLHALDEQLGLIRRFGSVTTRNIQRDHMSFDMFSAFTEHETPAPQLAENLQKMSEGLAEKNGGTALSVEDLLDMRQTAAAWPGDGGPGNGKARRRQVAELLRDERDALNRSETFYVTTDMSRIIEVAARTAPCDPLRLTDLPCPNGFVYFDHHVESLEQGEQAVNITNPNTNEEAIFTDNMPFGIRAIRWGANPGQHGTWVLPGVEKDGWKGPGLILAIYDDRRSEQNDSGRLYLSHTSTWTADLTWSLTDKTWVLADDDQYEPTAVSTRCAFYRKALLTFFRLTFQKIAVIHKERQVRQAVRRAVREGITVPDPGTINVVKLRREQQHPSGDPSHVQEWSHRWWVQGFWRNQWYPSLGRHQAVYIHPFIKGPLDKPLILKDRIYSLER